MSHGHPFLGSAGRNPRPDDERQKDFGYNLLLELDTYYSKSIKGLDETIRTKVHNLFMIRWSDFHAPVYSVAFVMDRQFCRRDMDTGVK